MRKLFFCIGILAMLALTSCEEYTPYARKYGYARIDLPSLQERSYKQFSSNSCPFRFEYPAYGEISRSSGDSCWTDIRMGPYELKWHITYRNVEETGKPLSTHFEEYRKLIYKHTKKATSIQENPIVGPTGAGTFFEIYGNVGTPAQVFFADTANSQVMMMSFYFQTALKNDSLRPVIDYMKEEVQHAISSLSWEN